MSSSNTTKKETDDKLFARILIWTLGRESISCNMICDTFHIGWRRATDFLNRLHNSEIAGELYEKLPRAVLPVKLEDLSPETVTFLAQNGYTAKHINEVLDGKGRGTRKTGDLDCCNDATKTALDDYNHQQLIQRVSKTIKRLQNQRRGRKSSYFAQ